MTLLKDIIEYVEDLLDDEKEITKYDNTITYNNLPNLYEQCPNCNSKEYHLIQEILEDAVMKVKCKNCELHFYTDWGK